jgi:hypothetical protein
MQKIYITFFLFIGLIISAEAQVCMPDSVVINPSLDSLAIFTPSSDSLPCMVTGQNVADTLYFTCFSKLHGFTIDSLTFDSINNLPPGICWETNSPTNTFGGGQNGALLLYGQVRAYPGQYKMVIYINAITDAFPLPVTNLETSDQFRYYLKAICPNAACPAVDTVGGKDSLFIPYPVTCNAGIQEINYHLSHISVMPNPVTETATVTFDSDIDGAFTLQVINLLGEVVSTKDIKVTNGSNQTTIDRTGLSAGTYILSLSDGGASVTNKIVIE